MSKSESYTKVYKKQFRLFDVYRYIATGEQSHIKGISSYSASTCALQVIYDTPKVYNNGTFFYDNEDELKKAISQINKCLNNCHKPGKKVNKMKKENIRIVLLGIMLLVNFFVVYII